VMLEADAGHVADDRFCKASGPLGGKFLHFSVSPLTVRNEDEW
jgi:hypothetical protein